MESLLIEATDRTPIINFDLSQGKLIIEGSSVPEDTLVFYKPVFSWLDSNIELSSAPVTLEVRLKFFNTSTAKCLFTIFQKLQEMQDSGRTTKIIWYYRLEDTDMFESGLDFQNMVKTAFEIVKE